MSFWNDMPDKQQVSSNVVDLLFRVRCRGLPSDHAHELRKALSKELPWLNDVHGAALIPVLGATSGNGWFRPEGEDGFIHLSHRAFFGLRMSREAAKPARRLVGRELDVCGESMTITHIKVRSLLHYGTLSARHLALPDVDDETAFLAAAADCLRNLDVSASKMMGGRRTTVLTGQGRVPVRNLMVSELTPEASLRLQETGIGGLMMWGCGVFLPHKGIAPVSREQNLQH